MLFFFPSFFPGDYRERYFTMQVCTYEQAFHEHLGLFINDVINLGDYQMMTADDLELRQMMTALQLEIDYV